MSIYNKRKKILFSHQSTLAHYRIDFYNELENLKPEWLEFEVLIDKSGRARSLFFNDKPDIDRANFNLKKTNSFIINRKRNILFQSFIKEIPKYDLIILQHALHNLSYPISYFIAKGKTKVAYWGHGRDILHGDKNLFKKGMEAFKIKLAQYADGYFAYTDGVKRYLVNKGVDRQKIFTVNNTIDITSNRKILKNIKGRITRKEKHLVYVGRLKKRKKINYILEVFEKLSKVDHEYCLHIVGGGDEKYVEQIIKLSKKLNICYYGVITDPKKLGEIFCQCQYLLFPGDVGLGPLHALCFDVIPIVINGNTHGPEFDYLNDRNSLILESGTKPEEMANFIKKLIKNSTYTSIQQTSWESIKDLTMKNMANNFIYGINKILNG